MAPKRKKVGLTRMDAAVDHMGLFGFHSQLVRKTVRNLLKVYGNDGWPFIEANAYTALIDALLDIQVEESQETQDASADKAVVEYASVTCNGESSEPIPLSIEGPAKQDCVSVKRVLRSSSSNNVDHHSASEINLRNCENASRTLRVYERKKQEKQKLLKAASLTNNAESSEPSLLSIKGPVMQECALVKNALRSSSSDNIDDQHTLRVCDVVPTGKIKNCNGWISDTDSDDEDTNFANEVNLENYKNVSNTLRVCDVVPTRTRKACNGWISDDDDDEGTKFLKLA